MMRKIIWLLLLLSVFSCKKDRTEPEPPTIGFDGWNYLVRDASGQVLLVELVITFKDRNGDIGRIDEETVDKCNKPVYDLFMYYEKKVNGSFEPEYSIIPDTLFDENCNVVAVIPNPQVQQNRSVHYIEPEGINKSIEGEIAYKLDYESTLSSLSSPGRFRIFLLDRARNKSNEIYTEELVLK